MHTIMTAAVLAVGLVAGIATANAQRISDQATTVIEHHSTAHNIGICVGNRCTKTPAPPNGK